MKKYAIAYARETARPELVAPAAMITRVLGLPFGDVGLGAP